MMNLSITIPVIDPMEIKLWSEAKYRGPSVHFAFVSLRAFRRMPEMIAFNINCRFKLISLLFLLVTVGGFAGCAPVLSKQLREEAEPPIPFAELQQAPDTYKGR